MRKQRFRKEMKKKINPMNLFAGYGYLPIERTKSVNLFQGRGKS